MCVSARRDGKTVVNSLWVDHSSEVGMLVDPASVSFYGNISVIINAYMFE